MKEGFVKRLAALCLSMAVMVSCCVPYGFAAEADAVSPEEAEVQDFLSDPAEAVPEPHAATGEEMEIPPGDIAETPENFAEVIPDFAVDTEEPEELSVTEPAERISEPAMEETESVEEPEAIPDESEFSAIEAPEDFAEAAPDSPAFTAEPPENTFAVLNDAQSGLTNFSSPIGQIDIDENAHTVTLQYVPNIDHFVVYDDLDHAVESFIWEADVDFPEGLQSEYPNAARCAALTFGFPEKETPSFHWYGVNLDSGRIGQPNAFRLFGPNIDTNSGGEVGNIDIYKTLHFKVDVHADGSFVYSFGNAGSELRTIEGKIPRWRGGYLGILTWNSAAIFSNITLEERPDEQVETVTPEFGTVSTAADYQFTSNITTASNFTDLQTQGGTWEARPEGLYSNAVDQGDAFLYSSTKGNNFVYSTDVTFLRKQGAACCSGTLMKTVTVRVTPQILTRAVANANSGGGRTVLTINCSVKCNSREISSQMKRTH